MAAWDVTDELFWSRLCETHRLGRIIDFPIDDQDRGHLEIGGFEKPEAENRLRGFQDEGLIKIDGRMYRLTAQGEQRCQMIPMREALRNICLQFLDYVICLAVAVAISPHNIPTYYHVSSCCVCERKSRYHNSLSSWNVFPEYRNANFRSNTYRRRLSHRRAKLSIISSFTKAFASVVITNKLV